MKKQRISRSFWLSWIIRGGAAALMMQVASAHQFWIEQGTDGNFIVRFGEAGSKGEKPGYEKSPGVLDKMQGVSVWSMYPSNSGIEPEIYKAKPQEDGFLVEEASKKLPLLAQTTFPVRKRAASEGTPAQASFTTAFARWQPRGAVAEPTTTLDLIPTGEEGEVTVFYKGKPQAGVKVMLFSATTEVVSMESDAEGKVSYKAGEKGDYILWAHHTEPGSGTYLGSAYNALTYMICLCWSKE